MKSARRPYLGLERGIFDLFREPVRFLRESRVKEGAFEKPYKEEDYQLMHLRPPGEHLNWKNETVQGKGGRYIEVLNEGSCELRTIEAVARGTKEGGAKGWQIPTSLKEGILDYRVAGDKITISLDDTLFGTDVVRLSYNYGIGITVAEDVDASCGCLDNFSGDGWAGLNEALWSNVSTPGEAFFGGTSWAGLDDNRLRVMLPYFADRSDVESRLFGGNFRAQANVGSDIRCDFSTTLGTWDSANTYCADLRTLASNAAGIRLNFTESGQTRITVFGEPAGADLVYIPQVTAISLRIFFESLETTKFYYKTTGDWQLIKTLSRTLTGANFIAYLKLFQATTETAAVDCIADNFEIQGLCL